MKEAPTSKLFLSFVQSKLSTSNRVTLIFGWMNSKITEQFQGKNPTNVQKATKWHYT